MCSLIPVIFCLHAVSSATTLSIRCPRACDCSHAEHAQEKILEITCFVWDINDVNSYSLSVVQEDFTLKLVCDSGIPVEVEDHMFSYLPYMKSISFNDCKISYVHRDAFSKLPSLHSIFINSASNFHLQFHPNVFDKLTRLRTLVMTGCGILTVPSLCSLTNLNVLNVSANSLLTFKDTGLKCTKTSPMTSLRVIDISNNYFQTVKEVREVGNLFPNVELFIASDNDIQMSAEENPFENFANLRILGLSRNLISELPDTLLETNRNIQEIRLSTNKLTHLPTNVFKHSSRLLQLELQENSLDDSIWLELATVKNLLYLDLSYNQMTFLNQTTITMLPELVYLNLAGNRISNIPVRTFQNQQQLQKLSLAGNMIHTLDNEALHGLLFLQRIELQNNRIYSMNQDILNSVTDLIHLNISHNFLVELPSLNKLASLLILDASHNSIDNIPEKLFIGQSNIRDINLSTNHITELPDTVFVSCNSLENLDLSNNFIKYIHPSLFMGLKIQTLYLQRNSLQDVGKMFSGLRDLHELNLSSNDITDTIQRYTFPTKLIMLDMSYNRIEHVRPLSFDGLDQIRMIDLRYNNISTLSKDSLKVSTGLYAQTGFRIEENPLKCDCNLLWLKHWNQATHGPLIVNLNVTRCTGAYNYPETPVKYVPEDRFLCKYDSVCTKSCKCCDFTACDCKYKCPDKCVCYNSADYITTHYIKCSNENITAIDQFIPKIATKLDYSGSDLTELASHSFIGMSNVNSLLLNNSKIKIISNGSFNGLMELKTLHLEHNLIKALWKDMFAGLVSLETLNLDNNYISYIQDGVFDHITSLSRISLTNNFLQYMSDYISALVFNINDISLYSNPWTCDCILFFSAREKPNAFVNMTDGIRHAVSRIKCSVHSINGLNQVTALQDYRRICERNNYVPMTVAYVEELSSSVIGVKEPDDEEQRDTVSQTNTGSDVIRKSIGAQAWNGNIKLLILVIVAGTIVCIVILMMLCRREFIKCWLFTRFRYKTNDLELLSDKTRFYDAFVAYHPRDEMYVIRELALRLERGEPKYLLQLQHRDFPSGTSVPNFIDSSVRSSHRTIVVLSSAFVDDNISLKCILESVKLDSIQRLAVVILDKVDKSKLDPVLRNFIKGDTCIRYGERLFWDKLQFCLPEPGRVERDIARAEVHPYACTDLAKLSTTMMDNQAYEEPFSVTSVACRPLPDIAEYAQTAQTYQYSAGSQQSSNIYEEIIDHENTSLKYTEPWTDLKLQTHVETLSRASKV